MERTTIPGTELNVSTLCYGGGGFGSAAKGEQLDRLINAYRQAGGNFLDTAHCYCFWAPEGDGASERAIAAYIRRNGKGDLVVATKGGHPGREGYRKCDSWLAPGRIEADIDDSLGRLNTDAIDLYWLHRDDLRRPVAEIVETLNREVRRGRIRYLGASNWSAGRIEEANAYAAAHHLRGFVASQMEWSLAFRPPQGLHPHGDHCLFVTQEDRAFYRRARVPVTAYSSTARGYFGSDGKRGADAYGNPTSLARLGRATKLAAELGATPNRVALAWLMHQEFPVFPILGTTNEEHLRDALAAADVKLTARQVAWLENG